MTTSTANRFTLFFLALTVLASMPLVAGFFGRVHPAFDSMAHFRVHLAIVMMICAVPLLILPMRPQGLVTLIFGAAALSTVYGNSILPGLSPVHAALRPKTEQAPVYRLMHMNVRFDNADPGAVLSLIGRVRPDVVSLVEVSALWDEKLKLLASAYPYRSHCGTQRAVGGVEILSRRPISDIVCRDDIVVTQATVDFGGQPVEVAAIHLPWPWPSDQRAHVEALAPYLDALSTPALVTGDLNATPWSETTRMIVRAGQLAPIAVPGPTWLYQALPEFLRFAGLPIDQAFAKGGVIIHSATTLGPAGSDHVPILIEFSLPPAQPAPSGQEIERTTVWLPAKWPAAG